MKIPLTPAGIEPAIFQLVAQHLNHCATAVSEGQRYIYLKFKSVIEKGGININE